MLTVSLALIAAALTLSTVAVTIAAYHDLRARDQRIRPQRTTSVDAPHAARPTLRLWQPPHTPLPSETTIQSPTRTVGAGPDIIVGPRPFARTTDEHEPPNAA